MNMYRRIKKVAPLTFVVFYFATAVFAGGPPSEAEKRPVKVIVKNENVGMAPEPVRTTKYSAQRTYATNEPEGGSTIRSSSRMAVPGLMTSKMAWNQYRQEEENILRKLKRGLSSRNVLLFMEREPDRIKPLLSLTGKKEVWEYFSFGDSTTLKIYLSNGRLTKIKKINANQKIMQPVKKR